MESPLTDPSSTAANEPFDGIPDDFVCPLTLSVMKDPVLSKYGHNFERQAIFAWMGIDRHVCPMTRQILRPSMLVSNEKLKVCIGEWRKEHGDDISCYDDELEEYVEMSEYGASENDGGVSEYIFGDLRVSDLQGLGLGEAVAVVRQSISQFDDDVVVMAVRRLAQARMEERERILAQRRASRKKNSPSLLKIFRRKSAAC